MIHDGTDDLPQKEHLIPDQEWLATQDAIDNEIIDPLADGRISKEAHQRARLIIFQSAPLMWQCRNRGRLYIDDRGGQLRASSPMASRSIRAILRSRPGPHRSVDVKTD